MKGAKEGFLQGIQDSGVFCSERKQPKTDESMVNLPKNDLIVDQAPLTDKVLDLNNYSVNLLPISGGSVGQSGVDFGTISINNDAALIYPPPPDDGYSRRQPRFRYQEPEVRSFTTPADSSMTEHDLVYIDAHTGEKVIITVKGMGAPYLDSILPLIKKAVESC